MRLALLVLALVALAWLVRSALRSRVQPPRPPARSTEPVQTMVPCAQCGVMVPQSEALRGRGQVFCCEAHRAEFERSPASDR